MKKSQKSFELEELAASQWGMFTTAQAQALGLQRNQISRLVSARRIEQAAYGVYRFVIGEETSLCAIKAAWLSIYPKKLAFERLNTLQIDAIAAGRTAAFMHGIGDFHPSPYTFIVAQGKQSTRPEMRYLMRSIDIQDIVFIENLPVTSIERTIYDLFMSHEDPELIGKLINDASRNNRMIDHSRLSELLAPLARRYGYAKLDGQSFTSDLMVQNAREIQIEHLKELLSHTIDPLCSADDLKELADHINLLARMKADELDHHTWNC